MKTNLVCRVFEFRQCPELFAVDSPCQEIVYKIPNGVVCHGPLDNIVLMGLSITAGCYKVEPFVGHFLKF